MIDIDEHVFYEFSQSIQTALKELSDSIHDATKIISSLVDSKRFSKQISSIDKRILQFAASEEYKNALEWGKYGWAYIEEIPETDIYYKKTLSIKDADELFFSYLTNDIINNIINRIYSFFEKEYQRNVYTEAKMCFDETKYRSCILLLFSLIDSLIISSQVIQADRKEWRKTSGSFAMKLNKLKENNHETIFAYLIFSIDINALFTFCGDGDNFVSMPAVANRNWISHGMYDKEVSKNDCIKVFVLLFGICQLKYELNLLDFEEPISKTNKIKGI